MKSGRSDLLALDAGLGAILLAVAIEQVQRNTRAAADNEDDVLLSPLGVGKTLAQRLAQVALVAGSQGGAAGDLDEHASVVGKSHAGNGGVGVGDDEAVGVGVVCPLPCLGRDAGAAERGGNGGDFVEGEVLLGHEGGVEGVGTSSLDADDVGLAAGPGEGLDALHEAVEEAAAADAADDAVHGDVHLVAQLGDNGGGAVPDVGVVKGRDKDAVGVVGQQLSLDVLLSGVEVLAKLDDLGAELDELVLHEVRGGHGDDNGAGAVEREGRGGTGEAGVASRGAVKVNISLVLGNGTGHEVANATGLEGAAGLEVVELEVDVAGEGAC